MKKFRLYKWKVKTTVQVWVLECPWHTHGFGGRRNETFYCESFGEAVAEFRRFCQ